MAARTTTKPKAAPVEEPEEDEFEEMDEVDDDSDLEELDEEEAPAKPKAKKAAGAKKAPPIRPAIEFSSTWLASYVTEKTGDTYDARAIRMLLRKMARDGKLPRVIGETRDRYEFTGPEDATVKAVIAMVTSGEAKALKQAGLQEVKDKAAAKRAAAKAAKEAEPTEDEGEDMEDADDEEDIPEEAPKPRPRRTAAPKTAAPAKATPATRRRTAPAKS